MRVAFCGRRFDGGNDMRDEVTDANPTQQMMGMITGYWVTQIIHAAAHYSLADHLSGQPCTVQAFATVTGLDRHAVRRFLRACAALGLVKLKENRIFSTPLLDTRRMDNPQSIRG